VAARSKEMIGFIIQANIPVSMQGSELVERLAASQERLLHGVNKLVNVQFDEFVGYAGECFSEDLVIAGFNREVLLCRSQWPRGLRSGSAAARLLELCVRIPPGAWVSLLRAVFVR